MTIKTFSLKRTAKFCDMIFWGDDNDLRISVDVCNVHGGHYSISKPIFYDTFPLTLKSMWGGKSTVRFSQKRLAFDEAIDRNACDKLR